MTVGEILSVKKVIQNVFPENRDLEEVCLKSKHTFFRHLDDPSTHEETNDYVLIKIKKLKDGNFLVKKVLRDKTSEVMFNSEGNII